jgi:DNA processing protein
MPTTTSLLSLLTTLHLPGIGPRRLRRWLDHFGDVQTLYAASFADLTSQGLTESQIHAIQNPNWRKAEKDLSWCQKENCHIISYQDARYPKLLNELVDAPLLLFVKGNPDLLSKPQLAIVGSRNPTVLGMELAEEFASYLTQAGLVITSGLALGIDAAAHKGALNHQGKTIGVCGNGLKTIYPRSNDKIAKQMMEEGAVISEFSPFTLPKAQYFPMRNRLISGLSLGVLVVEAAIKSGSLITAKLAAEQGREVFAIPGSIHNPLSRGCHQLIRLGAKLVETSDHIVEELGALKAAVTAKPPQKTFDLNPKQQHVLKQIGYEITVLDAIIKRSGLTTGVVSSILMSLELEGYIAVGPGGYIRCR